MKQCKNMLFSVLVFLLFFTAVSLAGEHTATLKSSDIPRTSSAKKAPDLLKVDGVKWEETFNSTELPDGWQIVDNDGSGSAFTYLQLLTFTSGDSVAPQADSSFFWSNFNNANSAGLIDEWIISPQIPLTISDGDSLHLYAGSIGGSFPDSLKIWVSTTDNNPGSFTEIAYFEIDGPVGTYTKYSFDLSSFAGSQIHVAANYYIVDGGPIGSASEHMWLDHFIVTGEIAAPQPFAAYLNAGQETAEVSSNGSGGANLVLSADSSEVSYEVTVRDLTGSVISAIHIHNGAAGADGPPVRTLFSGEDSTNQDRTYAGVWTGADGEPLTADLVQELLAGNLYINVHTDSFPPGEVRGQVVEPEKPKKLLVTEFAVTPTEGEMVEIHNPGNSAIDLTNYYLTDATFQGGNTYYYQIVEGGGGGGGFADFHARFPEGASIEPGEYQTVALAGDSAFAATFGVDPTYELYEDGSDNPNDVPDMREARNGFVSDQGGLTNGDEVIIVYYWDGLSDLVTDIDYVLYDDSTPAANEQVDKTGVVIDGPDADSDSSAYLPDTAIESQLAAPANADGMSTQRIDFTEGAQSSSGGNSVTGGDETSENLNNTFTNVFMPTPNGPAPQVPLNAPRGITASGTFTHVDLEWLAPLPAGEIGYDDGSSETSFGLGSPGQFAVRFSPSAYPAKLMGIKVYWTAIGTATDVEYSVWVNPDGGDAPPTSEVVDNTAHTISARGDFEEIDISTADITVETGDFYYSLVQIDTVNFGMGFDTDRDNASRSLFSFDGGVTWGKLDLAGFPGNLMVRALVMEGTGPNAKMVELDPVNDKIVSSPDYLNIKEVHSVKEYFSAKPSPDEIAFKSDASDYIHALQGYNIYRTTDGVNFSPVGTTDSTAFRDETVAALNTYGYVVTAVYDEGESGPTPLAVTATLGAAEEVIDHETTGIVGGVTNEGSIGYLNVAQGPGGGFQFNPNDASGQRLFDAGIMIGVGPEQVSDNVRDENQVFDADFVALAGFDSTNSTATATVLGTGYFDFTAENPIGVVVEQVTISAEDLNAFNLLGYQLTVFNDTEASIENLHVGGFFDWDLNLSTFADRGEVIIDSMNIVPGVNGNAPFNMEIVAMNNESDAYMGIVPLSTNRFEGRRVAVSVEEVYPPRMTDADKWEYMTQHRADNPNGDGGSAQDHASVFGLPPVDLAVGDSATLGFAMVAGATYDEMVANAKLAQFIWVIVLGNQLDVLDPIVGIEDDIAGAIPVDYALDQNYPNPFNPTTTLKYSLRESSQVKLSIYNTLGQLVTTLIDDQQNAGFKEIVWDGRDALGRKVASGIYIYRMEATPNSGQKFVDSKKMILLK